MKRLSTLGTWTVLALTAGSLLMPAAAAAQESAQASESSAPEQVAVRVENHNWLDMHVYLLEYGRAPRSLGMVMAQGSAVFEVPAAVTVAGTDLRVLADPVGSNDLYVSDPVLADPTSEVVVTLENSLALSNTTVQPHRNAG